MAGASYRLLVDGRAASPDLMASVQQVEVEDHASMADMLRLRIAVGLGNGGEAWTILDDDLFPRLRKLRVDVRVGSGSWEPLIEAHVVETSVSLSNRPGESLLNVVAMDPTVRMSLEEKLRPWPDMADSDIASEVFRGYGFQVDVQPTQPSRQEVTHRMTQRGTDIQFLRELAERNGYECYVELDPRTGSVVGHFHPPQVEDTPQGVLSVNLGESTNVDRFHARFEMLRPTEARIVGLDVETLSDQVGDVSAPALRTLGTTPLVSDSPRVVLVSRSGLSQAGELATYAQSLVDRSSWAIVAEGEVTASAYGGVLRAKRPVLVRGAGRQFSGLYYVEKVLHALGGEGYAQRFTLRRNALGLREGERFVESREARS